ncbi:hypothetical protein F5Y06DRAFT_296470 [Hypoxylon sp. FL0890]|nr:hypothetical protein F5Y06DRAFT_296470 [Hypoxylon sp. FL0890]
MDRTGYDLTYVIKRGQHGSQGDTEQGRSTLFSRSPIPRVSPYSSACVNRDKNSTSNNAATNTNTDQNSFLAPPAFYTRGHSRRHQQHHSNQRPSQRTGLSPECASTTDQYTLYDQQASRGWQRSDGELSGSSTVLGTVPVAMNDSEATTNANLDTDMAGHHGNTLSSSSRHYLSPHAAFRKHEAGIRKMGRGVRSAVRRLAQASQAAGRFLLPHHVHRSGALVGAHTPERRGSNDPSLAYTDPRILHAVPLIIITAPSDDEEGDLGRE